IVKDILVLWAVLAAFLVVAGKWGGWDDVFASAARKFAATPSTNDGLLLNADNQLNYITLALGSALALFLYPHTQTAALAARNRATLRRNLAALPLYTLCLGLLMLIGFAAIFDGVTPIDGDENTVIPHWFNLSLPDWTAGLAFAAIGVGAMVPAAIMSIAAANLFTRNVYREFIRPDASEREETFVSKTVSLAVKFGAVIVIFALDTQFAIDLQLIGGVLILQTLRAVALGLYTNWFHRWALVSGLVAGLIVGVGMLYQLPRYSPDGTIAQAHFGGSAWPLSNLGLDTQSTIYVGIVALAVNLLITVVLTPLLRRSGAPDGEDITEERDYVADEGDERVKRMSELIDGGPAKP